MEWLNYHHLLYFWTVVREGGVSRASQRLRLAQPTVSGQLKALEDSLGEKLFDRMGRRLELTEVGRLVYRYADEIFSLGRELQDTLKGRPTSRLPQLAVGIADALPKLIAYRMLEPVLRLPEPVRLVCSEDKPERLLANLSLHELDLVLSDAPVGTGSAVRAYSHPLGESTVSFFATPQRAATLRKDFPRSLNGTPLLVPTEATALRRPLDRWLDEQGLRPLIAGEFQDSALMKVFGQADAGVFPAPTVLAEEIRSHYGSEWVGTASGLRERFYVITIERRITHPAVLALTHSARTELFTAPK